jgi:membrane associated rhomboid family serine protease
LEKAEIYGKFANMFIYIPYGTDAPIYRFPIVSTSMIVISVVVSVMFPYEQIVPYCLAIGDGLHPLQWLTTNFIHGDIFHLIFNMLFLWVFGPVIEGRIGWQRMLVISLAMAILFGAIVQLLSLGSSPYCCTGTTGILYGLAAMSFVWAPESKVHGYVVTFFFRVNARDTRIDIMLVVGFFAVLNVLGSLLFGGGLIGELGNLVAALLGMIVAVTMMKRNLVDCDSQDIFSVFSGQKDHANHEEKHPDAVQRRKERKEQLQKQQKLLSEEIELALQNRTPLPAYIIAQRKEREFTDWMLPQELHLKMIQQLLGGKHWMEATASLRQYLERHQEQSLFVKLMLAQAYLAQNKPKSAIKILDGISLQESEAEQQSAIQKIRVKAEAMFPKNREEGIYELEE